MPIRIPEQHLNELAAIRDIGSLRLSNLASRFNRLDPLPLRIAELRSISMDELKDRKQTDALVKTLITFNHLSREVTPEDLLKQIKLRLTDESDWGIEEINNWEKIEGPLFELLTSDAVTTVAKASELAYDYANLFQTAKIITDVRPIFIDRHQELEISGSVIGYTLRLYYDNRSGNHSLSIAMDDSDLRLLLEQCQRALTKSQKTKEIFDCEDHPSIIAGADHDTND